MKDNPCPMIVVDLRTACEDDDGPNALGLTREEAKALLKYIDHLYEEIERERKAA